LTNVAPVNCLIDVTPLPFRFVISSLLGRLSCRANEGALFHGAGRVCSRDVASNLPVFHPPTAHAVIGRGQTSATAIRLSVIADVDSICLHLLCLGELLIDSGD